MSGLLAFLYTPTSRDALERSIPALADRGSETRQALDAPGALLATTVFPWQEELNGGAVGRWNDVHVVADATLYYRPTLVRSLTNAGFPPRSTGAGDLIAAAVAAWDADAPRHLEGDFAYIAYRVTEHRGHAARDPVGTRPLFLTRRSDGLALASSPRALAASGVASTSLNLIYLAELCAGMVNAGAESAFADVQALRQGERIRFSRGGAPTIDAYWDPPAFTERGSTRTGFADIRGSIADQSSGSAFCFALLSSRRHRSRGRDHSRSSRDVRRRAAFPGHNIYSRSRTVATGKRAPAGCLRTSV
jgi:asparagine synthase (glutamine-hydrolysing)